jgi:hypothetical protein
MSHHANNLAERLEREHEAVTKVTTLKPLRRNNAEAPTAVRSPRSSLPPWCDVQ